MIIATEIVKCVIYHSTKFYNECRILGFVTGKQDGAAKEEGKREKLQDGEGGSC
ncbi:hypothetical protein T11_16998 [Trichinella zimbabwensis]|uniref:Uncharacterized protein n=1 Tax=Trichinella zimbabwensis TaxID=268475 RepID=A0A0V1GWN1_9BILA|nr:hypothetical protein T11_16998 [Trichinella zimbabwensis]